MKFYIIYIFLYYCIIYYIIYFLLRVRHDLNTFINIFIKCGF